MSDNNTNQQPSVLTAEKVQQVIGAFARLRELGSTTIINPRNEAEVTGLKNFLAATFIEHGDEFVGCWVAVRQEYEPLVQTIERIANRIFSIRNATRNENQQTRTA